MKRVFIIHGWEGHPDEAWFPWLKTQLEKRGFEVYVPSMPNTEEPKIEEWVPHLKEMVKDPDENTFFVGHSIGCQTILRYLQDINSKVGGVVFVAGWVNLKPEALEEEGAEEIASPWLNNQIKWDDIRQKCSNFVALFSDDDPFVFLSDAEIFKDKLGAKIITLNNKGHIGGEANITELPEVLEELEDMQ